MTETVLRGERADLYCGGVADIAALGRDVTEPSRSLGFMMKNGMGFISTREGAEHGTMWRFQRWAEA